MTICIEQSAYRLRPFASTDVELFRAQRAQRAQRGDMEWLRTLNESIWDRLTSDKSSRAWTGFCGERLLGFAGLIEMWPTRLVGWAMLSDTVNRRDMLWIHRAVKREIHELPTVVKRVEITVDAGFDAGHRWAELLGFKPEGLMESYDPNGNDHVMFSRVRRL